MCITRNISKLLTLLGLCIFTTSVFAQTTTSVSVITQKTKVVKKPLASVASKTVLPIITDNIFSFVIEDDIMKYDGNGGNDNSEKADCLNNNQSEAEQTANTKILELEKNINIFPLPARDYFNISIEDNSIENFALINSNGQVVLNQINSDRQDIIRIETEQLAKGIYFVVLNTSNGRISKSILIQ